MVDTFTLTRWMEELGDGTLTIVERGHEVWIVGAQRPLTPDDVATWGGVPGGLEGAIDAVAAGFPLVQTDLIRDGERTIARFWAGLHGDGLSRQAFLLTASSVAKASRALAVLTRTNRDYATAIGGFEQPFAPTDVTMPDDLPIDAEPLPPETTLVTGEGDVVLVDIGESKLQVVTTVQSALGLDRAAALDIVNAAPTVIAVGLDRERANALVDRLRSAGATASVQSGG